MLFSDWLYRRRLHLEKTPLDRFRVRLARSVDDYEGAFRLVQAAYVARGIENVLASTLRINPHHVLPESYVLLAEEGAQLVGTMTVTLDSPAQLPLDKDYPEQLERLRTQGRRLAEFGSLAVVERCRTLGVTTLLNMAAFSLTKKTLLATDVVIGVNPHAEKHHRAVYDFKPLGSSKGHAQLVAPVVGLRTAMSTLPAFLARAFPARLSDGSAVGRGFFDPPACVELPLATHAELTRWKLSREVFRELFLRRSNRLENLDDRTQRHLEQCRSPNTMKRRPLRAVQELDLRLPVTH